MPEELEQRVADITDNLDNMDYQAAQDKLNQLTQLVDADSPIVAEMRTRLKMETS